MSKISELKTKIAALNKEIAKEGSKALKESFQEFFEAVPEALCIVWTQYTPYFNDGDACTFSLHDLCLKLDPGAKMTLLDQEEGMSLEELETYLEDYWDDDSYYLNTAKNARAKQIYKLFRDFNSEVWEEDIFESVFGDHVKVRATPNGKFDVKEHSHD